MYTYVHVVSMRTYLYALYDGNALKRIMSNVFEQPKSVIKKIKILFSHSDKRNTNHYCAGLCGGDRYIYCAYALHTFDSFCARGGRRDELSAPQQRNQR